MNFQVGDLKRIPVVSFSNHQKEKLGELAQYCHQKAKQFYELTNPTASYIDIKYNNLSQSSFANWFEQMAKQTSAENNQWQLVYASKVEAIKSEIKELESQIDSIVFEQYSKNKYF